MTVVGPSFSVPAARPRVRGAARPGPALLVGLGLLAAYVVLAVVAPLVAGDATALDTAQRLRPPGPEHWFGTDHVGRDVFARTVAGTRTSLLVGATVGATVALAGVALGLFSGYFRVAGEIVMRVMDGLMAIPAILLAIALAALLGGGLGTVIIAIAVPEIPRMARLIRSVVLSLREQLFVTAALALGAPARRILLNHILPNAFGPLAVQATFVCAAAIIIESVLSFLGVGTPPETASWGNVMSAGRQYFLLAPWIIAAPGVFLTVLVLAINVVGDALRDRLDPRFVPRNRT